MDPLTRDAREHAQDERAISSLCDRTGASRADVSALFAHEIARLALGATVRSYLRLLAAANVHAALRRRETQPPIGSATTDAAQILGRATANGPSRWPVPN